MTEITRVVIVDESGDWLLDMFRIRELLHMEIPRSCDGRAKLTISAAAWDVLSRYYIESMGLDRSARFMDAHFVKAGPLTKP